MSNYTGGINETTGDTLTLKDLKRAMKWLNSDGYYKQEADNYRASMMYIEEQQRRLYVNAITGNLKRLNKMKKWQVIKRWKTMKWIIELLFLSRMFESKKEQSNE